MNNIPYELIARYLAGECNEEEKQEVLEWSKQHSETMEELSKIWENSPSVDFMPDVEQALKKVSTCIEPSQKRKSLKRIYIWAGSVASAAIILLISIVGINNYNSQNHFSGAFLSVNSDKETIEYTLPDGSKIWLNRFSSLRYPEKFAQDKREVYLKGEAFFDIAGDAEKPFIIHANNTQTTVVGTSFGIRAISSENEIIVTVVAGVVNFSAENTPYIELRQGEQGMCDIQNKKIEKNTNPDPNLLAWKTKKMIFRQTPLEKVTKIIKNTYNVSISVDGSIAELQITSIFDQLSLEEVIQILEITFDIEAQTNENGILLTK